MKKKLSGLYQQEKQRKKNKKYISDTESKYKVKTHKLKIKKDKQIDFSDIPEIDLDELGKPTIGKFYRPIKKPVSIRLDADVLDWFRSHPGYQSLINKICRIYMHQHQKK